MYCCVDKVRFPPKKLFALLFQIFSSLLISSNRTHAVQTKRKLQRHIFELWDNVLLQKKYHLSMACLKKMVRDYTPYPYLDAWVHSILHLLHMIAYPPLQKELYMYPYLVYQHFSKKKTGISAHTVSLQEACNFFGRTYKPSSNQVSWENWSLN